MSLYDEVKKNGYADFERRSEAKDYEVLESAWLEYDQRLQQLLHSDIGQITSRDQIYDPYQLVQLGMYGNDSEAQAHYNADLAAAKSYVARQEAAYQEWYDSSEQKAARERAAGRNPDLMDISGTSGAVQTNTPEGSPIEGIPSSEQIFSNSVSGIASIVGSLSSVAGLATAFSNLELLDSHKNLLNSQDYANELSNIDSLKSLISSDISDSLATAVNDHLNSEDVTPFDYDSWFSNEDNFSPYKNLYGNFPYFESALALARKQSLRFHKNASELQKDALSNDFDFSLILSDPRLTASQKLTAIQLRPYTSACIEADKLDAECRKALSVYNTDYYNNSDGSLVAAFDKLFRDTQAISYRLESKINQGYTEMYDSEPNGYNGFKASFLFGSKGGRSWQDAFLLHSRDNIDAIIDAVVTEAEATKDTAKLRALMTSLGNMTPSQTDIAPWQKNKLGWSMFRHEMTEYLSVMQKIAETIESE